MIKLQIDPSASKIAFSVFYAQILYWRAIKLAIHSQIAGL